MSITYKLARRRRGRNIDEELIGLLEEHSQWWERLDFDPEARALSLEAQDLVQKYVGSRSISLAAKKEVLKKVNDVLRSFNTTCTYTGEPVGADRIKFLRYAIIGWTEYISDELVGTMNLVIQELLQNTNIKLSFPERESLMSKLLECQETYIMRLGRRPYSEAQKGVISAILHRIDSQIQDNLPMSRILDTIKELNEKLNKTPDEIEYPHFSNYQEFAKTVKGVGEAILNRVGAVENELVRIEERQNDILDLCESLAEGDSGRTRYEREFEILTSSKKYAEANKTTLKAQYDALEALRVSLEYVSETVTLNTCRSLTKYFRKTDYRGILSAKRYNKIMVTLDVIQKENPNPKPKPVPVPIPVPSKKESALDEALRKKREAQVKEAQQEQTQQEQNQSNHTAN